MTTTPRCAGKSGYCNEYMKLSLNSKISKCIFFISAIAFAFSIAGPANARKIKSGIPAKKISAQKIAESTDNDIKIITDQDTLEFAKLQNKVRFYGFDKTVTSTKESFFIVNGLEDSLKRIGLEITYLDTKGRQLHRREVEFDCDIPSNETRRCDIATWDLQKSFYYKLSAKPRRQATPFDVELRLIKAVIYSTTAEKAIID